MSSPLFAPPLAPLDVARALHPAAGTEPGAVADLEAIATGLATVAEEFELDTCEHTRRYRRVLATPTYDAWIIRWRTAAQLDLHDHGGSRGIVRVVAGELLEARADSAEPSRARRRVVRAGTSITIEPSTVHGVTNGGPTEALSVHVYSPPLTSMTFYAERGGALAVLDRVPQA